VITIVGLGPGDIATLSLGARAALITASDGHIAGTHRLFLRTARHPVIDALVLEGLQFDTFDSVYETAPDFATVYKTIADTVVSIATDMSNGEAVPVTFAVPGHPLFAEDSVRQIRELAANRAISVKIISSGSFVEAVLTAVRADLGDGCDVRDALTLPLSDTLGKTGFRVPGRPDPTRSLMLYQVFDTASASHTKLALMQDYPDDWPIKLVRWAGVEGKEEVLTIPLFRLDREKVDYLTTVFVPALPAEKCRPRFPELVGLMARLRAPDGCPWDREQTPSSLRKYLIEETYEALEAIDADDPDLLCEELGDVLLQVVFHAQLAAEVGDFQIDDVLEGIVSKLVRRHPHVFGSVTAEDSETVLKNWEQIKKAEKKDDPSRQRKSVLDGIPVGLPALMSALELSKRAVKVGFEWPNLKGVLDKVDEELAELKAELNTQQPDKERVSGELGDILFTLVQVARWNKIDPEEALRNMTKRFKARFTLVEAEAAERKLALNELTIEEFDAMWNRAKAALKSS
jgi:tetrapyrrole methylase family protein / MazG family protein